jgi:hypothetical protein
MKTINRAKRKNLTKTLNWTMPTLFTTNLLIDNSCYIWTTSVVEGLESMTSNPVTSLARVRSPGDALVV